LGQGLGERVERTLARPVREVPRLTPERAPRRHVDDPATAPPAHVAYRAPGHVRRTEQVDVERLAPGRLPPLVVVFVDGVVQVHAGVVDQDVETAERLGGPVDHPPYRVRVAEFGPHSDM